MNTAMSSVTAFPSRSLSFMFMNKLVNISPHLLLKRKAFPAFIFPQLHEKKVGYDMNKMFIGAEYHL
jgi:hypothetical protein